MFKGTWGLYPWFESDDINLIHESYRDRLISLQPYGKLFECIGVEQDYIVIQYNFENFKVKPLLYKQVPPPIYTFGETVILVNHPNIEGSICDIHWHHKYEKEIYYLELNGKKKSKRYFREDLNRKARA